MQRQLRELREFCQWPWTDIHIANDVTQARDFCALEVTFLNICKSSMSVALAAVSVLFRRRRDNWPVSWFEIGLVSSLGLLGVAMPSVAFYNYVHSALGHRDPNYRFTTTGSLWACGLLACLLVLALNLYQYSVPDSQTLGDVLVAMT